MENGKQEEFITRLISIDYKNREEKIEKVPTALLTSEIPRLYEQIKGERREREERWFQFFQLYYLREKPENAKEFQSKAVPPKPFYIVEQFLAVIRRSLMRTQDFFKVSSLSPKYQDLAQVLQRLLKFYLTSYNFLEEFLKAVKYGILTGEIILKVDWKEELEESITGKTILKQYPVFEALNPFFVVFDPLHERFFITRQFMPVEDVYTLQKMGIWQEFPVEPYSFGSEELEITIQKTYLTGKESYELCDVKEFWGTLIYQGKIYKNIHAIVVNNKYIAKIENFSFAHNSLPFVRTSLFDPFIGKWGYSLYDIIYDLLQSYIEFWRVLEDNITFASAQFFEINTSFISPDTLREIREKGLSPWAVIEKTNPEDVLSAKPYVSFNPNILPFIQMLNMEIQNATGITEFLMGQPTSKGRPTATEVSLKLQQSIAVMDTISQKIESSILSQLLKKLSLLIIEKENPAKLKEIVGEQAFNYIQNKNLVIDLIKENIAISVSGISEVLHRQEMLDKLFNFIQLASQLPNSNLINFNFLLKKISELLDFLPDEIFSPPSEETAQQQIKALSEFIALLISIDDPKVQKNLVEMLKMGLPPQALSQGLKLFLQIQKQKEQLLRQQTPTETETEI
ncbi:MAG: hypothetical protein ABIM02_02910 [candidate division WOR-3 bacterium]